MLKAIQSGIFKKEKKKKEKNACSWKQINNTAALLARQSNVSELYLSTSMTASPFSWSIRWGQTPYMVLPPSYVLSFSLVTSPPSHETLKATQPTWHIETHYFEFCDFMTNMVLIKFLYRQGMGGKIGKTFVLTENWHWKCWYKHYSWQMEPSQRIWMQTMWFPFCNIEIYGKLEVGASTQS